MAERIRPVVHLLFACDEAVRDFQTDRWILTNPWSVVFLPPGATFPFRAEEFWVYGQLIGGLGRFDLAVEMRHMLDGGPPRVVGWSPVSPLEFPVRDPFHVIDMAFALRNASFRQPGLYEIRILSNGDGSDQWSPLAGSTFEFRVLEQRAVI